jgi:hypothetical protein
MQDFSPKKGEWRKPKEKNSAQNKRRQIDQKKKNEDYYQKPLTLKKNNI